MEHGSETIGQKFNSDHLRKFKSDAVPSDLVDKVVEAGLYAATGKN
ncbi:MAG: hypothetical protein MR507_06315 [Succinivibrio sp.]|nr:hypothetical protein [Succinivibrio sp.]